MQTKYGVSSPRDTSGNILNYLGKLEDEIKGLTLAISGLEEKIKPVMVYNEVDGCTEVENINTKKSDIASQIESFGILVRELGDRVLFLRDNLDI